MNSKKNAALVLLQQELVLTVGAGAAIEMKQGEDQANVENEPEQKNKCQITKTHMS